MSQILDIQTVGDLLILSIDTNPTTGGGTAAPIGSIAMCADGSGTFTKTGALDTDWTLDTLKIATQAVTNNGTNDTEAISPLKLKNYILSQIPPFADEKQYLQITNFDSGSLPVGWSGSVIGVGSSVVYTQVSESGVSPGLALSTIATAALARVSLVTGSGYQFMRTFTDGPETTVLIQMRWSGVPSPSQCITMFGWINANTVSPPSALGSALVIAYDPANVSGFNPGLITNLFLLARSNYNGPTANTVVDLGVPFDNVNWRVYKITYDNVLNEVRVFRDNVLLTTLINLANVPAGLTRGTVPAAASAGLQGGFYIGNGAVAAPTGTAIRVAKFSVFKRYS